jgi:hypothetical protein
LSDLADPSDLSDLARVDLADLAGLAGADVAGAVLAGVDACDCSSRFLRSSVSPTSGLTCSDYAP